MTKAEIRTKRLREKCPRKKWLEQQHIARGKVYNISIIKCSHDKGTHTPELQISDTEGRVKYITRRIIIK